MQTNMSKAPLQRIPKAQNYFLSFSFSFYFFFHSFSFFLFFLSCLLSSFLSFLLSVFFSLYSAFCKPESTDQAKLEEDFIKCKQYHIQLNGDLHNLRDHPSLFCTLRFSMAIFLSISEQQNSQDPFPLLHVIILLRQPYLETPILPFFSHVPPAPRTALHDKPSASLPSTKSRFTAYHSDQRMSSTSADLLPAQRYKTAKHFPHPPMGVRSHFTTELSSIKQTEKQQGNIHVESTRAHRCTRRP